MDYLFTQTPLVFFTQNFWRDEAFSYLMSALPVVEIIKTTAADFNPPLYYLVLHYWMLLFGSSEVALRSLSVVFFAGTLIVLYEILSRVMRIAYPRAILYLIFIAFNPFLLSYAFEARMYLMVTFFITLSYFALWTNKKWWYIGAMVAALYTHYFAVFVLAAQFLLSTITSLSGMKASWPPKLTKAHASQMVRKILQDQAGFIMIALAFLPWALYLVATHEFGSDGFWIVRPPLNDLSFLPFVLFTGYERVFGEYYHGAAGYTDFHRYMNTVLWGTILIPLVFYISTLMNKSSWKIQISNYRILSLALWALFPPLVIFTVSLLSTPVYHPRYFIFAVPGLLLLIVAALEILVQMVQNRFATLPFHRFAGIITCSVVLVYLFGITNEFNTLNLKYRSKRTVSDMYSEIRTLMKPQDQILLTRDLDYPLARYYTRSEDIYIINKSYDEIPSYIGKVLIPEEAVTFEFPRYPSKAFVIYYDSYQIRSQQ